MTKTYELKLGKVKNILLATNKQLVHDIIIKRKDNIEIIVKDKTYIVVIDESLRDYRDMFIEDLVSLVKRLKLNPIVVKD